MFKWLKKKIQHYKEKRQIKKLPLCARKILTFDREFELGDKCLLACDFSKQKKRNDWKKIK